MAYWLTLDDLVAIQQLQAHGMQLDLERAVLWPHTPFHAALVANVPANTVGAESIVLYPAPQKNALGFAQMRGRLGRPEADMVFLAPALDHHADAVSIWYRLLAECAQKIGARGGQRLFSQVNSGNGVEEVFRQAGFNAYAHEDIFCLETLPLDLATRHVLRRQGRRDGWNLLRLYTELTPRPVQIAEGMLSPEGHGGKMGDWWDQSARSGFILELEGELAGAVRVQRGSAAYWLSLGLHPQAHELSTTLVRGALSLLETSPRHPIYCSVRDYESGIATALEQAGFHHVQTRSLLVKHTTARAKESFLKFVPALEKRPEPAASVSHPTTSNK